MVTERGKDLTDVATQPSKKSRPLPRYVRMLVPLTDTPSLCLLIIAVLIYFYELS